MAIRSNAARLAQEMREFVEETQIDDGKLVAQISRLVLKDCVMLTPPFGSLSLGSTNDDGERVKESFSDQRAIGSRAVSRDLNMAFRAVEDLKVISAPMKVETARKVREALEKDDAVLLAVVLNHLRYPGVTSDRIIEEPDEETHNSLRSRGRVLPVRAANGYFLVMNKPAMLRFFEEKVDLVGFLKSGWKPACDHLGVSLPEWIARHQGSGSYVDFSERPVNPLFSCENAVSYANDVTGMPPTRIIEIALYNRAENLSRQLQAKRAGLWNKHNGNQWSS